MEKMFWAGWASGVATHLAFAVVGDAYARQWTSAAVALACFAGFALWSRRSRRAGRAEAVRFGMDMATHARNGHTSIMHMEEVDPTTGFPLLMCEECAKKSEAASAAH